MTLFKFQMDRNRKSYVEATDRLVTFLDEVTAALQSTSPIHRKLVESTKAEVSKVARRANAAKSAAAAGLGINATKRFSLDTHAMRLAKAESMPGKKYKIYTIIRNIRFEKELPVIRISASVTPFLTYRVLHNFFPLPIWSLYQLMRYLSHHPH